MSDTAYRTIESVSPHYYSYESNRQHFEEETRRVEEIIEDEKRRETAAAEDENKIQEEKILDGVFYNEEIRKEEQSLKERQLDDEIIERVKNASLAEIERWLDYEKIRELEQLQIDREHQILEEMEKKRMAEKNAVSEYISRDSSITGININLLA